MSEFLVCSFTDDKATSLYCYYKTNKQTFYTSFVIIEIVQ